MNAFLIVDVQNDFISGSLNISNCSAQQNGIEVSLQTTISLPIYGQIAAYFPVSLFALSIFRLISGSFSGADAEAFHHKPLFIRRSLCSVSFSTSGLTLTAIHRGIST